ncbi:MAG: endonuclease [Zoogloeaceae bacterium]|nr:endonuclease [Zoogloeaceae bacterium]
MFTGIDSHHGHIVSASLHGCPKTAINFTGPLSFLNTLTERERLAWSAGLLDGDGCISSVLSTYRDSRATPQAFRIRVDYSQNCHFTLTCVQAILNERCYLLPVRRQHCQNRQPYLLYYTGAHAYHVLKKLSPFLVRKKREAEVCMQMWTEGQLGLRPGCAGTPPHLHEIRRKLHQRLKNLK